MTARLAHVQMRLPVLQVLAAVLLFMVGTATIVDFATGSTVRTMLVLAAILGLASLGQTGAVLLGGIDLSVPGFVLAGAVATAELHGSGWPLGLILLVSLGLAALVGGTTGFLCQRYRIQPLVLTLATGAIAGGATVVWSNGAATSSAPASLTSFTAPISTTLGLSIPPVVTAWVVAAVVVAVVLARTAAGRYVYLTGANLRAAQLALIPTARVWAATFGMSAACSALVGALLAGFSGTGDINLGDPYLFESLTAVIVGGTTFGARGNYWNTVLGALILTELTTILVGNGLSSSDQQIVLGLLILAVVAIYGRGRRLRDEV